MGGGGDGDSRKLKNIQKSSFERVGGVNLKVFFIVLCSTLSAAPLFPLCRRTLALNPGQLRLWHWQSDALTTWLDLIHNLARSPKISKNRPLKEWGGGDLSKGFFL